MSKPIAILPIPDGFPWVHAIAVYPCAFTKSGEVVRVTCGSFSVEEPVESERKAAMKNAIQVLAIDLGREQVPERTGVR